MKKYFWIILILFVIPIVAGCAVEADNVVKSKTDYSDVDGSNDNDGDNNDDDSDNKDDGNGNGNDDDNNQDSSEDDSDANGDDDTDLVDSSTYGDGRDSESSTGTGSDVGSDNDTEAVIDTDGTDADSDVIAPVDSDTSAGGDSGDDSAEVMDTETVDTGDTQHQDTAPDDTASASDTLADSETLPLDTDTADTATVDTATVDTATVDTATVDTATVDTATVDTATVDTDTATVDTATVDTETDSATGGTNIYITAGDWAGHGWTSTGSFEGGVITTDVAPGDYWLGSDSLCIAGTLARDYNSLGIIGFNLDQAKGAPTAAPWVPGTTYSEIVYDIETTTPLRVEIVNVTDGSDTSYCLAVPASATTGSWLLSSFKTKCWGTTNNVVYTTTTGVTRISVYAAGSPDSDVAFDFCIHDLHPE